MSENLRNIDGVFRKQLRDYSQAAPENRWGNIEQGLHKQKASEKAPFYKIAAAIAAFAIVGSGLLYLSKSSNQIDNLPAIAQSNIQEEINQEENASSLIKEEIVTVANNDIQRSDVIKSENIPAKHELVEVITPDHREEFIASADLEKEQYSYQKLSSKEILITTEKVELAIIDKRKQNIQLYLKTLPDIYYSHAENSVIEESKNSKWLVGGEFSPLYSYRNISETNGAYNEDFYNRTESPMISYTGGFNMQYKVISRLTIQAGVYYTTMGQSLDYMSVYANSAYDMVAEEYKDRFINSYSIENSSGDLSFNSSHVIIDDKSIRVNNHSNSKGGVDITDPAFNELDAEIQQSFQYVEVPLVLRYTLIDRNVNFNVIGGFGANFLVGNNVYLNYSGNKEVIGETKGVSPVNYNSTIGIGIEYPLMDKINIRLEPFVKYYLNQLNTSSSVESHPYSVGIYTGISYSF